MTSCHVIWRRRHITSRAKPRGNPPTAGNPHQSSHGVAIHVHGFATKTKALAREIPPVTQATYFGVLYKHETLHSHRACQTIVDVELFGTMPVSYFQLWDNLSVAYDKKNSFGQAGRKRKRYFCFDNIRIYCVLNSSNYCVIIDSSEKQKLI